MKDGSEKLIDLSVVVPVYGSPESLNELAARLIKVINSMVITYEIILVDDGCPDGSWAHIEQLSNSCSFLHGVRFSRNFGQHIAIVAGLEKSKGDLVVVMDCDLQDLPEEIPKLHRALKPEDWYVVGHRTNRKDSFFKRAASRLFHKTISYMTGTNSNEGVANFGIYRRQVIDTYLQLSERTRALQLHLCWLGYRHSLIEIEHSERAYGTSSYSLSKLLRYAFDLIICFSDKPIRLAIRTGAVASILSLLLAFFYVVRWLAWGSSVEGWTSIMVSVWFLSGLNIMLIGVVGIYVARSFEESKNRPLYVIDKVV